MRIGFVGAGRMGCTMGKHLAGKKDLSLCGYYSRTADSARWAAKFTDTKYYDALSDLVRECDALFITTPDGQIENMAKRLYECIPDGEEKIFIHTSGALSSQVFSGMGSRVFGYSIHPMCAVSSKTKSHIDFKKCFITIEGHAKYLEYFRELFTDLGHAVKLMRAEDKTRYHGAAVMASNLVIGLYHMACGELLKCGFSYDEASSAINPLFLGNAQKVVEAGCERALTGPVDRCDINTISNHLNVFEDDAHIVYKLLSKQLVDIAGRKNGNDMSAVIHMLNDECNDLQFIEAQEV